MTYDPRAWAANAVVDRPRRRWTRWSLLGGLMLMVGGLVVETQISTAAADGFPDWVLIWLPLMSAMASPFARGSVLTRRGLEHYDEFERTALELATAQAYLVMMVGIASLIFLAAAAVARGTPPVVTPRLLVVWATAILAAGLAMPVLFAEFAVPFPPPADDEGPL